MAAQSENKINLLPKKEFDLSASGIVLNWVLTSFRYIVIVMEIVVMGAFITRFWLDTQNSDLMDEIKKGQASLQSFSTFEKEYTGLQKKLLIYSLLTTNRGDVSSTLNRVVKYLPSDTLLSSINIQDNNISILGMAANERSIQQLIANLESDDKFKSVNLQDINIENKDSNLITFKIGISTKEGGTTQ